MTGNIIGKERIKSAKKLAKVHGVAVLGWNDRPGKEFISFNGDGNKLRGLQEEMEKAGWHAWPVDEGQQGHFMDFGMYPAPADLPTNQDGITPDDATEEPMTIGDDYRYGGPDGLYLYNIVVLTILILAVLGDQGNQSTRVHPGDARANCFLPRNSTHSVAISLGRDSHARKQSDHPKTFFRQAEGICILEHQTGSNFLRARQQRLRYQIPQHRFKVWKIL